jgi:hypothetical protein
LFLLYFFSSIIIASRDKNKIVMGRRKAGQEGGPAKKITTGEVFCDSEGNKAEVLKVDTNSANKPIVFRTEQGEGKLPMEEFKKQFTKKITFVEGEQMIDTRTGESFTLDTDVPANVTRAVEVVLTDEAGVERKMSKMEFKDHFRRPSDVAKQVLSQNNPAGDPGFDEMTSAEPEQVTEPIADIEAEEPVQENGGEMTPEEGVEVAPEPASKEEVLPAEESVEENDAEETPESDDAESQSEPQQVTEPESQPEPAPVAQSGGNEDSKPASSAGDFAMAGAATVAAAAATTYPTQAMKTLPVSVAPQQAQQPEAPKSPETVSVQDPATPEAPAEKKDVAFEQLKALLEEKRQEYVEDNYRHASSVSRLAKILGIVHIEKTPTYKEEYEAALRAVEGYERKQLEGTLQDTAIPAAEKAKLVESHFLRFSFEEKMALYELGIGVKMKAESDKWYTKASELVMQFGNGYRHLNWKQKAAIAAGVIGVGALAGATGGAAASAVAGALWGARRAATGTASFLAANEGTNKLVDWAGKRGATKEVEQLVKKETDPTYAALFAQLDTKISSLDKALEDRKRWGNRAKVMGIVSAVGLSGVTHLTNFFGWEESVPAGASAEHVSGAAASLGEQGMNHDVISGGSAVDTMPGNGAASAAAEHFGGDTAVAAANMPVFGEVDVTSADRARGLWGILDRQLPADMPKAERTQVIARLEALAKTKFAGKSPAEIQSLYGFSSGKLDVIRDEDVLKLRALFSQEEYAAALEGKGSVMSGALGTADQALQGANVTDAAAAAAQEAAGDAHVAASAAKEAAAAIAQDPTQKFASASLKVDVGTHGGATLQSAGFTPHPIDQMQGNYVSADQGDVYRGSRELLQTVLGKNLNAPSLQQNEQNFYRLARWWAYHI